MQNNNIFDMAVSVKWKDVAVAKFLHKVADAACETQTDRQTEMFYVNDVIWFSNPLQSLPHTDRQQC